MQEPRPSIAASGSIPRTVAVSAWPDEEPSRWSVEHYRNHDLLLARLGVPVDLEGDEAVCHFDEDTIRAYQLLHVFLHELGHHHDHATQRRGGGSRGENYAESYAIAYEERIAGGTSRK